MLHLLNLCFPTVFFFKHARLLPWQAVCKGFTVVSGYLPSSQWKCSTHPVTARLSICRFSIRPEQNPMILLRLSLTPSLQEFKARHSHSIPESYSEYHRQGLDFPDPHECRHLSSLYHEDSVGESKRYAFKLCCMQNGHGCQSRAFISENDNEGNLTHHIHHVLGYE